MHRRPSSPRRGAQAALERPTPGDTCTRSTKRRAGILELSGWTGSTIARDFEV